jgi:hypothetical protein
MIQSRLAYRDFDAEFFISCQTAAIGGLQHGTMPMATALRPTRQTTFTRQDA